MGSEFGFRLTRRALDDLDDIVSYLAIELSNPNAATHFLDLLRKAVDDARLFPESGSPIANEFLPDGDVRRKMIGNYLMYYLPDFEKKTVIVLRIVYGRRNLDEMVRHLER